jgi:hypothetical protein
MWIQQEDEHRRMLIAQANEEMDIVAKAHLRDDLEEYLRIHDK